MFKYIALGLLSVGFIYKLVINLLSYRSRNNPIPSNVSDVYDYDEYLRWKKYHSECLLLDTIFDVINFLIFFFFILFDIYAFIGNEFSNQYLSSLMVVLFFFGVDAIISFIHQYIANMNI